MALPVDRGRAYKQPSKGEGLASIESAGRTGLPTWGRLERAEKPNRPRDVDGDGTDTEVVFCWGQPSRFAVLGQTTDTLPTEPQAEDPAEEEALPDLIYTEISRTTSDVRVENPDDADQYVIVQRIETIDFQRSDNRRVRFILNPPD